MSEIDRMLTAERHQVEEFVRLFQVPDLDTSVMVNHRWNLRDLLAHIVAWHESFALNVSLLARGEPPQPPRGTLREVNRNGVLALEELTVAQLVRRLRKAQRTIENNIHNDVIETIPYRKPGTSYTPAQHLDVVRGHIHDHFWEAVDKYATAKGSQASASAR